MRTIRNECAVLVGQAQFAGSPLLSLIYIEFHVAMNCDKLTKNFQNKKFAKFREIFAIFLRFFAVFLQFLTRQTSPKRVSNDSESKNNLTPKKHFLKNSDRKSSFSCRFRGATAKRTSKPACPSNFASDTPFLRSVRPKIAIFDSLFDVFAAILTKNVFHVAMC